MAPVEAEIQKAGKMSEELRTKLMQASKTYWIAVDEMLTPKNWDEVEPLDLSDMPVFTFQRETALVGIQRATLDLTILILLNALLFWGAAAIFVRSEVR